jgi:hypothetical protein
MATNVPHYFTWGVGNKFNSSAFADWLANAPESENIEDRHGEALQTVLKPWSGYQEYLHSRLDEQRWEEARRREQMDENIEKWTKMIRERDEEKERKKKRRGQ